MCTQGQVVEMPASPAWTELWAGCSPGWKEPGERKSRREMRNGSALELETTKISTQCSVYRRHRANAGMAVESLLSSCSH